MQMLRNFLLICLSLRSKEDVDVFLTVASTVFILPHSPPVQLESSHHQLQKLVLTSSDFIDFFEYVLMSKMPPSSLIPVLLSVCGSYSSGIKDASAARSAR